MAATLLNVLGYVLTMTGLLTTILIAIGRRQAWIAIAVAVAIALLSQLIFEGWLGTNLPHSHSGTVLDVGVSTWASPTCSTASPLF